jgi:hypothetical protein
VNVDPMDVFGLTLAAVAGAGIGDDDPWTMRLAAATLTIWAIVGARLFGLI